MPPSTRLLVLALVCACGGGKPVARTDSAWITKNPRDTGRVATASARSLGVQPYHDWKEIRARDTLVVLTPYNSTTYFIYRGVPMGYEYELLTRFARAKQVTLKLVVVKSRDSLLTMLRDGKGDVAAGRIIPLPEDSGKVRFTVALYQSEPVLVQQKAPAPAAKNALAKPADTLLAAGPASPEAPRPFKLRARPVAQPKDLAGSRVTLPKRSPYRQTLLELADTISGDIDVVEVDESAETLIQRVAKGDVAFTVAEANLALLQGATFRNLTIHPILGSAKRVVWAVRPDAPALLDTLNEWLADQKNAGVARQLYQKYFINRVTYEQRVRSPFLTSETGALSAYDSLLKFNAQTIGWDWRLLAAQAYQESKLDPGARSWAGAVGLLQLMPATAGHFGVHKLTDPSENVRGAVAFLAWLDKRWRATISDSTERLKFVLASYNAGAGHVEDAQRLAAKHGNDPHKWDDVAYWLLQESRAEYYTDPVVKYGFCRGLEPVTYVRMILERYTDYQTILKYAERIVDRRSSLVS